MTTIMKPVTQVTTRCEQDGQVLENTFKPTHASIVIAISDLGDSAKIEGHFVAKMKRERLLRSICQAMRKNLGDDATALGMLLMLSDD